jgi:Primosomal protein N'' (replication factor Y) - superfamily II helicase
MLHGRQQDQKNFSLFEALKPLIEKGFQGLILLPEIGLTSQV